MSETINYNLPITEDDKERFLDWRNSINGPDNSAMVKIDKVLGDKADHSDPIETVLKQSDWSSGSTPYIQVLSIEGLTDKQNGVIGVSKRATGDQRAIAREAVLFIQSQDDGTLTIGADGDRPTADIPVTIILLD